jgi:hypothetical protein
MHAGYHTEFRNRYDALYSVRAIAKDAHYFLAEHGRWPPHLAALMTDGTLRPKDLRYRKSSTPELPPPHPTHGDDWRPHVSSVDAHSDFLYLAGDLPGNECSAILAPYIIVACGKPTLPEVPAVTYNTDAKNHEYAFAAHPVSFADGRALFIPPNQLPTIFSLHNAARSTLALPPHPLP